MIKPHGSAQLHPLHVDDPAENRDLTAQAHALPSARLSSSAAANAVMLGGGYFNPLRGFMDKRDALSVADSMRMSDGLFWPVPVLCLVETARLDDGGDGGGREAGAGDFIALRDPNVAGQPPLAVLEVAAVEAFSEAEMTHLCEKIFATADTKHPGVAAFMAQGRVALSGAIRVLNFSYFAAEFAATFRTAVQIRAHIEASGWRKTVAFQTRNPMHRAHEELCRLAMQRIGADGCVIHMLLGKLKPGDIPAEVRDAAIRKMVEVYFPPGRALISGYGFDMLYAGPREAVLHALFRQNMGATHLIIGRDHAGVGDYYGAFDAQTIFDHPAVAGALDIEIFRADHTAYSKKLNQVVMMREAPNHGEEDFVLLSGTKVREMLSRGIAPPPEFSRPEVARILMDYYQGLQA
ncbi:MAG: sulfate adenylyltransferase [Gammaproteobacteria bacterium]|nr:sulfate adenylyltransferase [Gammaproteobacteria bacterium]